MSPSTLLVNEIKTFHNMNEQLVTNVLKAIVDLGTLDFCVCPGGRNSPFVVALKRQPNLRKYYFYEERSAAFFALGLTRKTSRPVAVISTSGTAAGEMLPAAMEAYYTGVPLILITADRPRRFRGTGAPQTAEQVGLYGQYAVYNQDLAEDLCEVYKWNQSGPAHLNVCFEEPLTQEFKDTQILIGKEPKKHVPALRLDLRSKLDDFLSQVEFPFVVVSKLKDEARDPIAEFLLKLNAPVYLEGISGLREDQRLSHLKVNRTEKLWDASKQAKYPIDGVLRIGGVPTFRFWRDLEDKQSKLKVCSVNDVPFSGLSWSEILCSQLQSFFNGYIPKRNYNSKNFQNWLKADLLYAGKFEELCSEEPLAEPSLIYKLSKNIPPKSIVYLGNSLPIREWDLAAFRQNNGHSIYASRGLNGIDGQISTFLGLCRPGASNWGILGDLTTLYDMAGPWIMSQMTDVVANIVVINNGGGRIFDRMFPDKEIQNLHYHSFRPLAHMWNLSYEQWSNIPSDISIGKSRLIEIIPDDEATSRFWKKMAEI